MEIAARSRGDAGLYRAGTNGIATDIVRTEIASNAPGESDESVLYGCIGGGVAAGDQALHRGDVDDGTLPRELHVRKDGLGEILRAHQRDLKAFCPFRGSRISAAVPLAGN